MLESSASQFPCRTACYCDLPNGERVWICTLNSAQRLEAERKARRYAATECRSLLPDGSDYGGVVAEVKTLSPEAQAAFLAQQDYWQIYRNVEKELPLPPEPEQGEQTPELYTKAVAKWEKEKANAEKQREEEAVKRFEAAKARYLALPELKRLDACCTAYYNLEFGQAYLSRLNLENLLRAVRNPDAHLQRRFASLEEVEDLDDAMLQALLAKYDALDTLSPSDLPTAPSV